MSLLVYDGGAWKNPIVIHVGDPAGGLSWRFVSSVYLFRNNTWQKVFEMFIPTSATATSVLSAAVNIEPHKTYWNQLVGGRKLGDLSGNGVVQTQDALEMNKYVAGNFAGMVAGAQAWVEGTVIPFATVDPPPSI